MPALSANQQERAAAFLN